LVGVDVQEGAKVVEGLGSFFDKSLVDVVLSRFQRTKCDLVMLLQLLMYLGQRCQDGLMLPLKILFFLQEDVLD
jgi:hypothetical protein